MSNREIKGIGTEKALKIRHLLCQDCNRQGCKEWGKCDMGGQISYQYTLGFYWHHGYRFLKSHQKGELSARKSTSTQTGFCYYYGKKTVRMMSQVMMHRKGGAHDGGLTWLQVKNA